MSMHCQASRILPLASLALALAGCPDDAPPSDDTDGSGSGTSVGSTSVDPDGTTTTVPTSTSSTSVDPDTTSGVDSTTGEPPVEGTCSGLNLAGNIGNVLSRDGMPIDTTCTPIPAPCGGDPVGTWMVESWCGYEAFPNPFEAMCPGSTVTLQVISQVGSYTFENDGTYLQDLTTEVQIDIDLDPMACFGVDCATWEMLMQMDNPAATCQAMGPNCSCTSLAPPEMAVTMGTYEVIGDEVVVTVDGDSTSVPFCIEGDRLAFWSPLYSIPEDTMTACVDDQECMDAFGDMYDLSVCVVDEMPGA